MVAQASFSTPIVLLIHAFVQVLLGQRLALQMKDDIFCDTVASKTTIHTIVPTDHGGLFTGAL